MLQYMKTWMKKNFYYCWNELEFKFNEAKGFPCLDKPVPYCLSDAKGNCFEISTANPGFRNKSWVIQKKKIKPWASTLFM